MTLFNIGLFCFVMYVLYICAQNGIDMNTVQIVKRQTAFRFSEELLQKLREKAQKENRSLNNYVEKVLTEIAFDEPNAETAKAIEDARNDSGLTTLDLKKFKEFVAQL